MGIAWITQSLQERLIPPPHWTEKLFAQEKPEEPMTTQATRLPSRFPVGTKFVIESRPARSGKPTILSRYVELPDGRSFSLPSRVAHKSVSKTQQRAAGRRK
jgi:hypothetical protein